MSTPFQNRLVGTIIVAAGAIIFLPDLLDGKKQTYQASFQDIPQPAQVENVVTPKEFPEEKLNIIENKVKEEQAAVDDEPNIEGNNAQSQGSNDTVNVTALPRASEVASTTTVKTKTSSVASAPAKTELGQAWVIQLGSFSKKKNVDELVNKLTQAGYVVFTKPVKTKNRTLTKVFVGPDINKSELEKQIPKLAEIAKVTGKIAKYTPTKS